MAAGMMLTEQHNTQTSLPIMFKSMIQIYYISEHIINICSIKGVD
jgi:hypothetical protein